jgi:hypothetical protein
MTGRKFVPGNEIAGHGESSINDDIEKMSDDELLEAAPPSIIYEVPGGLVAVTVLMKVSKKNVIRGLRDILESIEQHGVPKGAVTLK